MLRRCFLIPLSCLLLKFLLVSLLKIFINVLSNAGLKIVHELMRPWFIPGHLFYDLGDLQFFLLPENCAPVPGLGHFYLGLLDIEPNMVSEPIFDFLLAISKLN